MDPEKLKVSENKWSAPFWKYLQKMKDCIMLMKVIYIPIMTQDNQATELTKVISIT